MLNVGDRAPAFALQDDQDITRRSSELKGRPYVLFFYPKDNTPGCSTEACGFRDLRGGFDRAGIALFGVSADSAASHARFVAKHGLGLRLLADPEHGLLEAYGVWAEKSLYGRKFMGIVRSTFAIGADGRISHVWPRVKPAGHAEQVLAALSGAAAAPQTAPGKAVRVRSAVKPSALKQPAATSAPSAKPATRRRRASGSA
jgi:peroxiredoxin Q/BCP